MQGKSSLAAAVHLWIAFLGTTVRCNPSDKVCSPFHHRSHNLMTCCQILWMEIIISQSSRAGLHRFIHLISTECKPCFISLQVCEQIFHDNSGSLALQQTHRWEAKQNLAPLHACGHVCTKWHKKRECAFQVSVKKNLWFMLGNGKA